ncbi:hypothetical protein [Lacticaseibacillus paracasei]|uniref:hypothetical protein n=1 Tax=Lacticaseibacillus paracasei TaxID=1597 RepID=UPI0030CA6B04
MGLEAKQVEQISVGYLNAVLPRITGIDADLVIHNNGALTARLLMERFHCIRVKSRQSKILNKLLQSKLKEAPTGRFFLVNVQFFERFPEQALRNIDNLVVYYCL